MGGRDSSSKRKPSKRKRDKISSKKKSRRKEPKKRRRICDSVTSSDNDSLYSERSSSSISKSDCRRRINKNKNCRHDSSLSSFSDYESVSSDSDSLSRSRKVRRSQVRLKVSKRRSRKRSSSPSDVDVRTVRKRKRLDRDLVTKPTKKCSKRKPRGYLSSSSSFDSESCSTCQSSSSSSAADGKRRRSKAILNKKIERRKSRKQHKGKNKGRVRTPSCSPCGMGTEPNISESNSDGVLFPMNNSRRLRSVIAVVDQPHDEGENRLEMNPHKEEIVYDQNDYPSPKSIDSNEGGSKMESGMHSHGAFFNRICIENVSGEEVTELGKSRIDEGDQNKPGDRQSEGAHLNVSQKGKKIDVSVPDTALGGDVLESILRQKALENLRKFQGRLQASPTSTTLKMKNESDVHRSARMVDAMQNKSIKLGSSNAQEMNQKTVRSLKTGFSLITEVNKLPDSEEIEKDPGMDKLNVACSPNVATTLECSGEYKHVCCNAVLAKPVSSSEAAPGTARDTNSTPSECLEEYKHASSHSVLAKPLSRTDATPGTARGTNALSSFTVEPSSSVKPISGEHSLERGNEAKDGSQFEQKTMSVMRGGELVQVSYKVYIPKKAPALARRQLRR